MHPSLVILAAGVGRRFGGDKQLHVVGPGGETLMDYNVYDALRAGFSRVVFVIRPEMEQEFTGGWLRRLPGRLETAVAVQRLEDVPSGCVVPAQRVKPWGTGHAVLAARGQVAGPFAVVNADDLYGAEAYQAMHRFLVTPQDQPFPPTYALVGYRLADTLSDSGAVSRGVCRVGPHDELQDVVEISRLERHNGGGRHRDAAGSEQVLSGDTPVSMNLWGFLPALFDQLQRAFEAFFGDEASLVDAELILPGVIRDVMHDRQAVVRVLRADSRWCGMTYPEDAPRVRQFISHQIARGVYPEKLWT